MLTPKRLAAALRDSPPKTTASTTRLLFQGLGRGDRGALDSQGEAHSVGRNAQEEN